MEKRGKRIECKKSGGGIELSGSYEGGMGKEELYLRGTVLGKT